VYSIQSADDVFGLMLTKYAIYDDVLNGKREDVVNILCGACCECSVVLSTAM